MWSRSTASFATSARPGDFLHAAGGPGNDRGWRQHYNRFRPHSASGYRPPSPEAIETTPPGTVALPLVVAQDLTWGADCNGGQVPPAQLRFDEQPIR